jgi:hypothetical protein
MLGFAVMKSFQSHYALNKHNQLAEGDSIRTLSRA